MSPGPVPLQVPPPEPRPDTVLCRLGIPADLPAFEVMLRRYLLEQRKDGSPVRVTKKTVDFYRELADSYLRGSLFGGLVLAEEGGQLAGFVLGGEDTGGGSRLDTDLGRVLIVWAIWVEKTHRKVGTALTMLRFAQLKSLELGFEVAVMSVREENKQGLALVRAMGVQPVERIFTFRFVGA